MGAIPQKWIFACVDCGCIFTTMAEKQTGICPVCKSSERNTIEDSTIRKKIILNIPFLQVFYIFKCIGNYVNGG
jgi:hypothetical protein